MNEAIYSAAKYCDWFLNEKVLQSIGLHSAFVCPLLVVLLYYTAGFGEPISRQLSMTS